MPESTGGAAPVAIPHSPAEWAAMQEFFAHVGSKKRPNCRPCAASINSMCKTGTRLRRAVARATTSRTGQGAR